ncbi:MAG: helix-turn-helix transcriptional regulator [Gammaproteobacteria bacterium]|nr:helix-turn-helix transcriptional regulator [Gammaproteobacteria bacterium]
MDEQQRQTRLLEVIGTIYDAAMDADRWPEVLAQIAALFDVRSGLLRFMDPNCRSVEFAVMHNYDEAYVKAYAEHFVHNDPVNELLMHHPQGGGRTTPLVDLPNHKHSEYYNDYARPQEIEHLAGAILSRDGESLSIFGLQRSAVQGPFTDSEMLLLRTLFPHLQRALKIHGQFGVLRGLKSAAESALEFLPFGVVALDENGKVILFNRLAQSVIDRKCGVLVLNGRLTATGPGDKQRLQRLVANAIAVPGQGGGFQVQTTSPAFPVLMISTMPLTPGSEALGGQWSHARALLFISAPERSRPLDSQLLANLFSITSAEARIARDLMRGLDIKSIAEHNGVTQNTVKTQVRQLMRKTNTRRQAELVQLLLNLPSSGGGG